MNKILKSIKLILNSNKINLTIILGSILSYFGININEFYKEYSTLINLKKNSVLPLTIIIYNNKVYTIIIHTPVTSFLILNHIKKLNKKYTYSLKNNIYSYKFIDHLIKIKQKELYPISYKKIKNIVISSFNSINYK